MKKVLSLFLLISVFASIFFIPVNKISFADDSLTIEPKKLDYNDNPFNVPSDISFFNDCLSVLNQPTSDGSEIREYNLSENEDHVRKIELDEKAKHLTTYDNTYFFTSKSENDGNDAVFVCTGINYLTDKNYEAITEQVESFYEIFDLISSSKSLFLIGKKTTAELVPAIYKYNESSFKFELSEFNLNPYGTVTKFAYSEVAKKAFIYDYQDKKVKIIENESFGYHSTDIVDIICDFEGNLYIIESNQIIKYPYLNDYNEAKIFPIKYKEFTISNTIAHACFKPTGQILLLCDDELGGTPVSNAYFIPKSNSEWGWDTITSTDIPNIPELSNINIFDLENKIDDFYVAKIIGYPSDMLYSAINGNLYPTDDEYTIEKALDEKIIVFEKFGIYSYVLYQGEVETTSGIKKISSLAVVYNNSLQLVDEIKYTPFKANVLFNKSKVYLYPSYLVYEREDDFCDFKIGELNKYEEVMVLGETEINNVSYYRIKYDNDKEGYINKAEISEQYTIETFDPRPGRIDSNKDIPLYEDSDILSTQIAKLSHKQPITILVSGRDFCYIEVEINGKLETGYVETQFILESGLSKLQKIGLWIFITAVLLGVTAIVLRVLIVRRRNKYPPA